MTPKIGGSILCSHCGGAMGLKTDGSCQHCGKLPATASTAKKPRYEAQEGGVYDKSTRHKVFEASDEFVFEAADAMNLAHDRSGAAELAEALENLVNLIKHPSLDHDETLPQIIAATKSLASYKGRS